MSANESMPVDSPDVFPSRVISEKPKGDIGIPKFDKVAYQREYMRIYREKKRAAK